MDPDISDITDITDMFAKCNVNKLHLSDKIDECGFCNHMAYDFVNYPHSFILGINVCSDSACIKKAKDVIYNYCISEHHYPITTMTANDFSLMKLYSADVIWILEPYTHTFIENGNIYVTIRNTFSGNTQNITLEELCKSNGLAIDKIIQVFQKKLHNFIYVDV